MEPYKIKYKVNTVRVTISYVILSSELSQVSWIFTDIFYSIISDALTQIQNKHSRNNGGALCFHYHDQELNITHWRTSWDQTLGMLRRSNTTKLFQAGVPPPYHKQYIKGNFLKSFLESNLCHSYRHFPPTFSSLLSQSLIVREGNQTTCGYCCYPSILLIIVVETYT